MSMISQNKMREQEAESQIMVELHQNFKQKNNESSQTEIQTMMLTFLKVMDCLKDFSPDHNQQLMFLIKIFNKNNDSIAKYYSIEEEFSHQKSPIKFSLDLSCLYFKIDLSIFVSFNTWNHLVDLSLMACDWLGNEQWRIIVEQSQNFINLKWLWLSQTKISQIKEGEIERFSNLGQIYFQRNPLTYQTELVIKNLQEKNTNLLIAGYRYQQELKTINLRVKNFNQRQYLRNIISELSEGDQWILNDGKFSLKKWDIITKFIKGIHTQLLFLQQNNFNSIPTELMMFKWYNLKAIILNFNKINNIQPLCFLNAQFLQEINIYENNIINFKPLNKMRQNKLMFLDISINNCQQIQQANRIKMYEKVETFKYNSNSSLRLNSQDKAILVKVEAKQVQTIYIQNDKTIEQQKVTLVLLKRFFKNK